MPRHIDNVISGVRFTLGYAELLCKGITPDIAALKPRSGPGLIDTNHPTFVFGHLSIYPSRALDRLGVSHPGVVTRPGSRTSSRPDASARTTPRATSTPRGPSCATRSSPSPEP